MSETAVAFIRALAVPDSPWIAWRESRAFGARPIWDGPFGSPKGWLRLPDEDTIEIAFRHRETQDEVTLSFARADETGWFCREVEAFVSNELLETAIARARERAKREYEARHG